MPCQIDSDVLIVISRGNEAARKYIDAAGRMGDFADLGRGSHRRRAENQDMANQDMANIGACLSAYVVVPLRASAGSRAYELLKRYTKSHRLHVFAATAIEEGLTSVTKNHRHFGMIEELNQEVLQY